MFITKKGLETVGRALLLLSALALLAFFGFRFSVSAKELQKYMSYQIPKEYHFSAQIQRNESDERITEFVPFGEWDNEEKNNAAITGDFVITRIAGNAGKGKLGAWYYNVGTYEGKTVDLKCTIEDYMQKNGPQDTTGTNLGWVALSAERLGIYVRYLQWVDVRLEFYDADTGVPLEIKSSAVITDVDDGEGMRILSECESVMVNQRCKLKQLEQGEAEAGNELLFYEENEQSAYEDEKDDWAQVQVLFDSSVFRYRTYSALGMQVFKKEVINQMTENLLTVDGGEYGVIEEKDAVTEASKQQMISEPASDEVANGPEPPEFMLHFQGYSDCRLAPLTVGEGELTATDTDESKQKNCMLKHREENFSYEMVYTVSPEYKNWYYDSFMVTGQLPDEVQYLSGEVFTAEGKAVSEQFFIRENRGSVTFEAKQEQNRSFYGKTYVFTINAKVKPEAELDTLWDGTQYKLPLHLQVEIIRDETSDLKETSVANVCIYEEYIDGNVKICLKDCLSGVDLTDGEFALLEWSEAKHDYVETKRIGYEQEENGFVFRNLSKTYDNRGKYKVKVSRVPKHYVGIWEQELVVKKNHALFEVVGKHQPTGETSVRMTSKILRKINGEETLSEEYNSKDNAVALQRGDRIQYHIYVERDSALSYKSGELVLKNKIPMDLLYEKATMNLIGEIQHPVENSTAKIASVRLDKDGVLTWKINHLDNGEVAHVIFEVDVPEMFTNADTFGKEEVQHSSDGGEEAELRKEWTSGTVEKTSYKKRFVDYAELIDGDKIIASNVLEHQLEIPAIEVGLWSVPNTEFVVHPRESVTYLMTAKNQGTLTAKNVMVRMLIPEGCSYVEDSLRCEREDAKLYFAYGGENKDICKMIYVMIPELKGGEKADIKVKVRVENTYQGESIAAVGEIRELWQQDADIHEIALEIAGFQKSEPLIHMVERYPEIEPPEKKAEDGIEKPVITPDEMGTEHRNSGTGSRGDNGKKTQSSDWAAKTGDTARMEDYVILGVVAMIVMLSGSIFFIKKSRV